MSLRFNSLHNGTRCSSRLIQQVKRPLYLSLHIEDETVFDVGDLLRGKLSVSNKVQVVACSILSETRQPINQAELLFLAGLPAHSWSRVSALDLEGIGLQRLVESGLLISDSEDVDARRFRHQDELLASRQWHPFAAFYHFASRHAETTSERETDPVDLEAISAKAEEGASRFLERYGAPPPPFRESSVLEPAVELPVTDKQGGLYDALRRRRTVRKFDTSRSLSQDDLSTLLRYVFGCHGYTQLSEVVLLHKTSPSGGSLHPIEAYPLILDVENLSPGVYHYNVRDHSLELIRELEIGIARDMAIEFCRRQQYAGSAHALILMTARFYRNQWKYRSRSRTYGVMLMDAGHLSQTFYLVAAELGLGAFYSAAVNGQKIEEVLGLDGVDEGALGVCGCGIKRQDGNDLGLEVQPFEPRSTRL